MNLLLLCMNYAPERTGIAPFTTDLAEYLAARGHQVTVATTFPHYPEWETYAPYRGQRLVRETRNGVTILRRAIPLPKRATMLRRIWYDTMLGVTALWSGFQVRDYDLALAVEPPIQAGVAARVLAARKRVPYALWIQDLALEAASSVGMLRSSLALRIGQRLERWSHARAKKIFVIARGFQENLMRKGLAAETIICLPNWTDVEMMRADGDGRALRREFDICADATLVVHSGNMGVKQQLENVLGAAHALRADSEIVFLLVGDGSQKNGLMEEAARENLSNVRFAPLLPRERLPELMGAADILLLNQHPDLVEAVIPSKLLTYMAAGRPIVVAAHPASEAARLVRDAECGVSVSPDAPDALAQALVALARDAAARAGLGARGRAYVESHFARAAALQTFERALLECVA